MDESVTDPIQRLANAREFISTYVQWRPAPSSRAFDSRYGVTIDGYRNSSAAAGISSSPPSIVITVAMLSSLWLAR